MLTDIRVKPLTLLELNQGMNDLAVKMIPKKLKILKYQRSILCCKFYIVCNSNWFSNIVSGSWIRLINLKIKPQAWVDKNPLTRLGKTNLYMVYKDKIFSSFVLRCLLLKLRDNKTDPFLVDCQAGLIVSDHFPWKVEHKIYMSKTKSKFYIE